jgi:hypothetical protein
VVALRSGDPRSSLFQKSALKMKAAGSAGARLCSSTRYTGAGSPEMLVRSCQTVCCHALFIAVAKAEPGSGGAAVSTGGPVSR